MLQSFASLRDAGSDLRSHLYGWLTTAPTMHYIVQNYLTHTSSHTKFLIHLIHHRSSNIICPAVSVCEDVVDKVCMG